MTPPSAPDVRYVYAVVDTAVTPTELVDIVKSRAEGRGLVGDGHPTLRVRRARLTILER